MSSAGQRAGDCDGDFRNPFVPSRRLTRSPPVLEGGDSRDLTGGGTHQAAIPQSSSAQSTAQQPTAEPEKEVEATQAEPAEESEAEDEAAKFADFEPEATVAEDVGTAAADPEDLGRRLEGARARVSRLEAENSHLRCELDGCRAAFREFDRCLRLVARDKLRTDLQAAEIARDRDQALEDLHAVEAAFSDLHKRFEKSKQVAEALRANEAALKRCVQECQARLKRNELKYQALKAHAEEKLEAASQCMEEQRRSADSDSARLQAVLRKAELRAHNLQAELGQKARENAELTSICDELIHRLGQAGVA